MPTPRREMFTQEFWDDRYGGHDHVWSGRPNVRLVDHATGLTPARALDVGCGEGGDAIWLATHGWTVTATDLSPVGLQRAAANATAAGPAIAARVSWRQADLFGDDWGAFDGYELVNSQYLHLPPEVRDLALQRLAAAVLPGGDLLVVAHHPSDLDIPGLRPNMPELFCTASELAAGLDPARWEILTQAAPERSTRAPDGRQVVIADAVLHARRRG
jgi:SAM-dependent methyltransferase